MIRALLDAWRAAARRADAPRLVVVGDQAMIVWADGRIQRVC